MGSRVETTGKSFQSPSLIIWIITLTAIALFEITCFQPSFLPCDTLGQHGDLMCNLAKEYNNFLKIGFWFLILVHVAEAIYATKICRELDCDTKNQVKWVLQTFFLGILSLRLLLKTRKNKQV